MILIRPKMNSDSTTWHHAPLHIFVPNTMYMVTAGTLHKQHLYAGRERLELLQTTFLSVVEARGWKMRAWALFSNHYHFIAKSPEDSGDVRRLIQHLHSESAKKLNQLDSTPGRKVWYQYWDRCLTFEKSYYPRLNYVMNNPVRHGLVELATQYPFCSASWFRKNTTSAQARKVASFKHDRIGEKDDFNPIGIADDAEQNSKAAVKLPHSENIDID